jgi:uncharacterized protein involved in exopolysaccharide biosynthesis
MDDEIDLRIYLKVLVRNWKWIVGSGVVAAVLAFIITALMPPVYEASALIAVTKPRYVIEFDRRFETTANVESAYKAYPDLATSSSLLSDLLNRIRTDSPGLEAPETVGALQSAVEAKAGADPSLIYLMVKSGSREDAAGIADRWADLVVEQARLIYGPQQDAQLSFIEEQLTLTRLELDTAEAALVEFESRNLSEIITSRLTAYQETYGDHVRLLKSMDSLKRNIVGLQTQFEAAPRAGAGAPSLADQLTLVLLQVRAFEVGEDAPFEIQLSDQQAIVAGTLSEQLALLKSLLRTLDTKASEVEAELQALEPAILDLQRQLSEMQSEAKRLQTQLDVTRETYLVLARKHAEVSIASRDEPDDIRRVGSAVAQDDPVSPRKLLSTVGAGAAAVLICMVTVLFVHYWREE